MEFWKLLASVITDVKKITKVEDVCIQGDSDHSRASTQFLIIQKNLMNDLQEHLDCFCNVLPILVLRVQKTISF